MTLEIFLTLNVRSFSWGIRVFDKKSPSPFHFYFTKLFSSESQQTEHLKVRGIPQRGKTEPQEQARYGTISFLFFSLTLTFITKA